jgi:hypothetical protein
MSTARRENKNLLSLGFSRAVKNAPDTLKKVRMLYPAINPLSD